jgi:putative hydrolase of the HAD superfamily
MMSGSEKQTQIRALFLDVGGVLLTNAWDDEALQRAAREFNLDLVELRARHAVMHETYELGKISLDDYMRRVVFHTSRPFAPRDFTAFMCAQSRPLPGMIELFAGLKAKYNLRVVVVSNEGRELMDYRVNEFHLTSLADIFVVSCSLHMRKPDPQFYRAALDISRVPAPQTLYIDNSEALVEAGREAGLRGLQHKSLEETRFGLAAFGLHA